MSFRDILVPLDGSAFSQHALPVALSLSRRAGAALHLAQVHQAQVAMYAVNEAAFTDLNDELLRGVEWHDLQHAVDHLKPYTNRPCTASLIDGAPACDALVGYAGVHHIDLIVMSTHGRGPASRFWLGSTTDALMRLAPCPVLALRPKEVAVDLQEDPTFHRVLVPLDGSPHSEAVLECVVSLGSLFDAEYHLLRVAADPAAARRYLEAVRGRFEPLITKIDLHVTMAPHVPNAILDSAAELGADLIALETHGYGGFQRLRLGSVADQVLRAATVPVLTHRLLPAAEQPAVVGAESITSKR